MAKPKDPRVTEEDALFKRSSPKARALLAQCRKLKRDAARRAWWKENGK